MIPSLVAGQLREAIVEYLSTTFALSDDETRQALAEFLADTSNGIFRGPFLRVRTPFRQVDAEWQSPLDWLPDGFRPYHHQAAAFERLSSRDGEPSPTLVTTGTGSGKTEAFLYPILDHCLRANAAGRSGIKALVLYPMNALATDQARRLAQLLDADHRLAGVTAGLYIGGDGSHDRMGADHLIDRRDILRSKPPDILLTNYKMLDLLLLRREDRDLWAAAHPDTLQYVVLDEFHTYDGAQGTDVAMLLRRLGAVLGVAEPGRPLGSVTPVATSATLGSGTAAGAAMREFAGRVFGTEFDEAAVITESRQSAEEACDAVDYTLPIPEVADIVALPVDDLDEAAMAFTGSDRPLDVTELGAVLLRHPLTRAVLAAASDRSRSWDDALDAVVTRAPNWGAAAQHDRVAAGQALARYLALLSVARRPDGVGGSDRPLFSIEVQLWVREVSRLVRTVDATPTFRWADSAPVEGPEDEEHAHVPELPAIYCRHCGRAGWMAVATELDGSLQFRPREVYAASLQAPARVRALLRASPEEPDVRYLDPDRHELLGSPAEGALPVLVTASEDEARRSQCPSCAQPDGIRFLGSQVASLASVTISQMFGSNLVHSEERKLLAFTDSVQDASHRASFFAGRTFRFNARTQMATVVRHHGDLTLHDLADELLRWAGDDPDAIHALVPPDLLRHRLVRTTWTATPSARGQEILRLRLALEAALELGLRARVGRTLELTGTVAASVDVDDFDVMADLAMEAFRDVTGLAAPDAGLPGIDVYLRGLLERLRLRGGIVHPWLEAYVREDGNQWRIWGGRDDGMPPFVEGQSRPAFFTTAPNSTNLDSLTAAGTTPTWLVDWVTRTLGVSGRDAASLNWRVCELVAAEGVLETRATTKGATVFGLHPRRIRVHDVGDDADAHEPVLLRCRVCVGHHVVPPGAARWWIGAPCLRYRCPGCYEPAPDEPSNYYRNLYRSETTRRVVTAEHTGLLERAEREELESLFKDGDDPDAPNVIACTPTMEMGIDIGDLSAVLLTSVPPRPASYVQRVGRAGRLTGNAFVAAFIPTNPRALYYLEQPEHMIAGEIRPPSCYLDAKEILERQFLAFLIDRSVRGEIEAPPMPAQIGQVMRGGLDEGGWMRAILDACLLDPERHATDFLSLFGDEVSSDSAEELRSFAASGIEVVVKAAFDRWQEDYAELGRRRNRMRDSIERLEQLPHRDAQQESELRQLRGERTAVVESMRAMRSEPTLGALSMLGLLPNYTLLDDAAALDASLWSSDDEGNFHVDRMRYERPAASALTEFAPGNSFYGRGHRLLIDGLEVGGGSEPVYESWRLCPDCGFGAVDEQGQVWTSCPRCGNDGIADTGAQHTMLRMRQVYCSDSEESSRVFDESDERDRHLYNVVSTVDVDPAHVVRAWRHRHVTFGMEWARTATIRSVNVGPSETAGERVRIGGRLVTAARFKTCRYCGVVEGVRRRGEARHRGWCQVKSGARAERWDTPVLFHEVTTEAVRLLVPVSMFEVDERLASFKAALLLGLRLDFGGEPEHLDVLAADFPASSGLGRRRFLVVHDTVPGGTGCLGRIADPERLGVILRRARDVISTCPCREEGRNACHRCLLGAVAPREIPLVSRTLAIELLDDLLDAWEFDPIPSVADLDIGLVQESELERRFRVALEAWASRPEHKATMRRAATSSVRDAWELRLEDGDETRRYLIEEQRDVPSTPPTRPDYLITRQDASAPEVAVYLDGFQYHASPEHLRVADDATKREALRRSGRIVWSLTWDDVEAFHDAATGDVPREPPDRPLLQGAPARVAERVHHEHPNRAAVADPVDVSVLHRNPVRLLLDWLRSPDLDAWEAAALSMVAGAASAGAGGPVARADLAALVQRAMTGDRVDVPVTSEQSEHVARTFETAAGLPMLMVLDARASVGGPNDERWTIVVSLDDREPAVTAPGFPTQWRDWLQWANVVQFVRGDGRETWICTASLGAGAEPADLAVVPAPPAAGVDGRSEAVSEIASTVELTPEAREELDLIMDDEARDLIESVLRRGAPIPVAGWPVPTPDGSQVEAAWPDEKVAIVVEHDEALESWLDAEGWQARPAEGWTVDELLDALRSR